MQLTRFGLGSLLPVVLTSVLACSDNPTDGEPDMSEAIEASDVSGNYLAFLASLGPVGTLRFTSVNDGVTVDWIAQGALLQIRLLPDGTTTGSLDLAGGAEDGGAFHADLAGTWGISDGSVQFDQTADTFIRDVLFRVGENQLMADTTIGDTRIEVVLRRDGHPVLP